MEPPQSACYVLGFTLGIQVTQVKERERPCPSGVYPAVQRLKLASHVLTQTHVHDYIINSLQTVSSWTAQKWTQPFLVGGRAGSTMCSFHFRHNFPEALEWLVFLLNDVGEDSLVSSGVCWRKAVYSVVCSLPLCKQPPPMFSHAVRYFMLMNRWHRSSLVLDWDPDVRDTCPSHPDFSLSRVFLETQQETPSKIFLLTDAPFAY